MKNRMIRLLALALALVMLLSLAACGGKKESSSTPPSSSSEPSSVSSEPTPVVPAGPETSDPVGGDGTIENVKLGAKIAKGMDRNEDTIGWITIPNMEVDDAVIQYIDNEYYLRLDEDKNYSVYGCYWADPACILDLGRDELSRNTIIYGHSSYRDKADDPKFSQLFHYLDLDFLKENPYIYFSTEDDDMVWQVFAVFYTHINFDYIQANPTAAVFDEIVKEAKERSEYIIDLDVSSDDKILTLSTCTGLYNGHLYPNGDYDNYRYVVMAKLLPAGATGKCTTAMSVNPSPKKS